MKLFRLLSTPFRRCSTNAFPISELRPRLAQHVNSQQPQLAGDTSRKWTIAARGSTDSFDKVLLPFGSDPIFRDQYVNIQGFVRFGKILEDLDDFAVWLSYRHNQGAEAFGQPAIHRPMSIVTACVDRIDIKPMDLVSNMDVLMQGQVSWVGRSSMETNMDLLQKGPDGSWNHIINAKFVMVAQDPTTGRAVQVCPLITNTTAEENLFKQGEKNKSRRQSQADQSLLTVPPNEQERLIVHRMFLNTLEQSNHSFNLRQLPEGNVWMEDNRLKNLIICHPQQRNVYGKIFGGFLMRKAFELGWANACLFSRTKPARIAVDDIMFRRSVDIGSLLFLSSDISYTDGPYMQVRVHAEVVNFETGVHRTTNTFNFTFTTLDGSEVKQVMPRTYGDMMLYLDGKRHLDAILHSQNLKKSASH